MRSSNAAIPPAPVLLTPEELEAVAYRDLVRAKIQAGIESAERGPALSVDDARAHFAARAQARSLRSAR